MKKIVAILAIMFSVKTFAQTPEIDLHKMKMDSIDVNNRVMKKNNISAAYISDFNVVLSIAGPTKNKSIFYTINSKYFFTYGEAVEGEKGIYYHITNNEKTKICYIKSLNKFYVSFVNIEKKLNVSNVSDVYSFYKDLNKID